VLRFTLHRQGQKPNVFTRCHDVACSGLRLVLPERAGPGYRPTELNVQPAAGRQKVILPARNDRVSTLGEFQ
jgi:hypothetical protein